MLLENTELNNDISVIEEERVQGNLRDLLDSSASRALLAQETSLPAINVNATETLSIPTDPWTIDGGAEQWHHVGEYGLNTIPAWNDYTGDGVLVAVIDDGFNYNHSELSANYRTDIDLDVLNGDNDALNRSSDTHGTFVSQVIAADDNGTHGAGVAFDSEILGIRRGFGGQGSIDDTVEGFEHALAQGADILNNSWGITSPFGDNAKINFAGTDTSAIVDQFANLVENGRDGLGANIVFSAGNSRAQGSSANYKNYQNSPYTITVGAINEGGTFASFSEAGSNLLVTAPGDSLRCLLYTSDAADE